MRAIRGSAASRAAGRCSKYTARLEPCTCGWRSLELTWRGWEDYIIERPYTKNLTPFTTSAARSLAALGTSRSDHIGLAPKTARKRPCDRIQSAGLQRH